MEKLSLPSEAKRLVNKYAAKWSLPKRFHEDAVQEVCLKLWESEVGYKPDESKIPFLRSRYAATIAFRAIREMHLKNRWILSGPNPRNTNLYLGIEEGTKIIRPGAFEVGSNAVYLKSSTDEFDVAIPRVETDEVNDQEFDAIRKQLVGIVNTKIKKLMKKRQTMSQSKELAKLSEDLEEVRSKQV